MINKHWLDKISLKKKCWGNILNSLLCQAELLLLCIVDVNKVAYDAI